MQVIVLAEIREALRLKQSQKDLDVSASIVLLEQCLHYLDMNNLEELQAFKKQMKNEIKKLKELSKNVIR